MKAIVLKATLLVLGFPLVSWAQEASAPATGSDQNRPEPIISGQDARGRLSDNPANNPIVREGDFFTNRPQAENPGAPGTNPDARGSFSRGGTFTPPPQEDTNVNATGPGRQNMPGITEQDQKR